MNWTYYKQDYGNGVWALFRSAPGRQDEAYRRGDRWHSTNLLLERRQKGDISASDGITEQEAEALMANTPACTGSVREQIEWTYYLDDYGGDGAWILFRSASGRADEIYRRGDTWHPTKLLFERRHKGDISSSDIITEAEADALVASLATTQPR